MAALERRARPCRRALCIERARHELELRRRIGVVHRTDAYVAPLAQRMIALPQERTE